MKLMRGFLLGLGLVCSLGLPSGSLNRYTETVKVEWGKIGYNIGPLESKGFHHCSAVILDYGDSAFLAHAFPDFYHKVCSVTIVDELVRESRRRGLSPENAEAILNIGNKDDLEIIERGLRKYGIRIRQIVTDEPSDIEDSRDIRFDPSLDSIRVTPTAYD